MAKATSWYQKGAVLAFGGLFAASSLFFAGCGDSTSGGSGSSPLSSLSSEKPEEGRAKLSPYVSATNAFNGNMVTFGFSIQPSLEHLRNGEQQTHISLPAFQRLQTNLTEARKSKSGFDDVDKAADDVLNVLKEIVPIADRMDSYYSAKTYLTDGYAQAEQDRQQFLPLYDKFTAAYDSFNGLVDKHNHELQQAELEAMKKAGKKNTALFLEVSIKASDIMDDMSKPGYDAASLNQRLNELAELNNAQTSDAAKLYRDEVNRFIGRAREYLASGGDDDRAFNDLVEEYNDTIDDANRIDMNQLDGKK
mgnify:CR=1 FL=1